MATAFRDRLPALGLVTLLHVAAAIALFNAIIIEPEPEKPSREEHETQITLTREAPRQTPKRRRRAGSAATGSNAISGPYFNPDTYRLPPGTQGVTDGVVLALAACNPGRIDLASREVRAVCDRIGLALKNDPGRFGVVSDISDPVHWRRELARREAPVLAPCMSPGGFDVLFTLSCLYENVFVGYKPEHRRRYSE